MARYTSEKLYASGSSVATPCALPDPMISIVEESPGVIQRFVWDAGSSSMVATPWGTLSCTAPFYMQVNISDLSAPNLPDLLCSVVTPPAVPDACGRTVSAITVTSTFGDPTPDLDIVLESPTSPGTCIAVPVETPAGSGVYAVSLYFQGELTANLPLQAGIAFGGGFVVTADSALPNCVSM